MDTRQMADLESSLKSIQALLARQIEQSTHWMNTLQSWREQDEQQFHKVRRQQARWRREEHRLALMRQELVLEQQQRWREEDLATIQRQQELAGRVLQSSVQQAFERQARGRLDADSEEGVEDDRRDHRTGEAGGES